jgi:hypothetical protein
MNFEVDKGILFGKMVVLTVMINNLSADQQLLVFLRNSHQQFLSPQDWSFGGEFGFLIWGLYSHCVSDHEKKALAAFKCRDLTNRLEVASEFVEPL